VGELKTLNEIVDAVRLPNGDRPTYPGFMPRLDASALREIGASYVAALRKLAPESERITDKMPSASATRSIHASRASRSCFPASSCTPTTSPSSAAITSATSG
jgi:hypothetical protein